jgi:hypothetical protein
MRNVVGASVVLKGSLKRIHTGIVALERKVGHRWVAGASHTVHGHYRLKFHPGSGTHHVRILAAKFKGYKVGHLPHDHRASLCASTAPSAEVTPRRTKGGDLYRQSPFHPKQ